MLYPVQSPLLTAKVVFFKYLDYFIMELVIEDFITQVIMKHTESDIKGFSPQICFRHSEFIDFAC